LPEQKNKFNKLNYFTLNEADQKTFGLRTIRTITIKQNSPKDDESAMYEIFNRLNISGINLKPLEIRASLYHSEFYEMLNRINKESAWRELLSKKEQDIHMKDIEILLRGLPC
jgi:hypothetical protein